MKLRLLESLQWCREYYEVILTVFLLYIYRYTLYKSTILPRQNAVWRGHVRWECLCGAAFKHGHRKLMNVRNCAIPHTLYNFIGCLHLRHLHTRGHIIYLWNASVTMKYAVEPSNDVVHVQWKSNKVIINVSIFKIVFVSELKAASYATGKRILSSPNGLFHWTAL